MTDPNPTPGQEPGGGQPPAGTDPKADPKADPTGQDPKGQNPPQDPPADPPTEPKADPSPQSVDELPEWAKKEIKDLRSENARRRKADKQAEDANKTELQKRDEEISELRTTNEALQRQVRRASFIESIGLPNPRAAWGYVLDGTVEIEWDENNKAKNLEQIRKTLKEEDGALFGNGSADGGTKTVGQVGYQGPGGPDRIAYAYEQNSKS